MKEFISDEDMAKLEANNKSSGIISDEEMAKMEANQAQPSTYEKYVKPIAKPVVQGLGTAGGALAGIPGGPAGMVLGAGLGNAGATAGYEALENAIRGKQQPTLGESATNAAGNFLSGAGSEALGQSAVPVVNAINPLVRKVASGLSGVSERAIQNLPKYRAMFDTLKSKGEANVIQDAMDNFDTAVGQGLKNRGQNLANAIDAAKESVNIQPAKEKWFEVLAHYKDIAAKRPTEANLANVSRLQKVYDDYFSMSPEMGSLIHPNGNISSIPLSNNISANDAFALQKTLKDIAKFGSVNPKLPVAEQLERGAAGKSYGAINDELARVTGNISPKLKEDYGTFKNDTDALQRQMGSTDSAYSMLKNANRPAKKILRQRIDRVAEAVPEANLAPTADMLETASYFMDPSLLPLSGGSTSTSKTFTGGGLGRLAAHALGGGRTAEMAGEVAGGIGFGPAAIKHIYSPIGQAVNKVTSPLSNIPSQAIDPYYLQLLNKYREGKKQESENP